MSSRRIGTPTRWMWNTVIAVKPDLNILNSFTSLVSHSSNA